MAATCRYFDGTTGLRLDVWATLDAGAGVLRLSHEDLPGGAQDWNFDDLRALRDHARDDQVILTLSADHSPDSALIDTARLTVDDPDLLRDVTRLAPNLNRRDVAKGTAWRVTSRVGLALGAVALMLFVILPAMAGTLARIIPIEREVAWGKSVVRQVERFLGGVSSGSLVCSTPEGDAALAKMLARLIEGADIAYDLDVAVMDHDMVNAFAAPGGQIVLVRGLIEQADNPESVAAVLGHEIGHVEARDTTRGALRAAGSAGLLGLVLGDFAGGGVAVAMAEFTINASYTREAEALADLFALDMLDGAGVDATGMADFFDQLNDIERTMPDLPIYLSSHPDTGDRADAARDFAAGQGGTQPVLTDAEWAALQSICG